MKALISVYNKDGVVDLARNLLEAGAGLLSTGGTYRALSESGVTVTQISDFTGHPEILDGRVKSLHPKIHGGILARRDSADHVAELNRYEMEPIDIVVVNLYPFEETIAKPDVTQDDAIENIDIGGPTLIRAAAKNHAFVVVLVDPYDYPWVADKLLRGGLSYADRRYLAAKAFQHVAVYDTIISKWLDGPAENFNQEITLAFRKVLDLRYGENPHQRAALYADVTAKHGLVSATQLHGKELSYNNIVDANAAWVIANDFAEPTVSVIKHANPCGLASNTDLTEAYLRAYNGDTVSAFGGIVGLNRPVTLAVAEAMRQIFYEVIVAPSYEADALALLRKKRDLRLLEVSRSEESSEVQVRRVSGGMLIQTPDQIEEDPSGWDIPSKRDPNELEWSDLQFAWRAVKHIKSNAIVLVKDKSIVGMGAGQPNRVTSVHLALRAAGEKAENSVLASDAFFPFPDGVELAANGGVKAVIQPGGSIRDSEIIEIADQRDLAMIFTGTRHFQH